MPPKKKPTKKKFEDIEAPKEEIKIPNLLTLKFRDEVTSSKNPEHTLTRRIIFLWNGHWRINYYNKETNKIEDSYFIEMSNMHEDTDINIFKDVDKASRDTW